MATATLRSERPELASTPGIVLPGASWADYEAMLGIIGERRVFVNYDQGVMEVLVPSHPHEDVKDCLRLLVDILSEELGLPSEAGGSTTLRRPDLEKGVEPDECYWFHEKAAAMIGVGDLVLPHHPAPSLAIEVNYTSSSVDRLAIYAALGVDEVWRYDEGIVFLALGVDGRYTPIETSRQIPALTVAEAMRQLEAYRSSARLEWMRSFRRYVREQIVPHHREAVRGDQ